ncbi:hypothetical protein G7939_12660 [Ralstonia solanacearum]|uniref:hypothetical protein n=1 Tax=Ralstonia pseudosolanacearum TaxID=1310165 RepID=UPI000B6018A7|nr:hypothetical protein [Ralstonia pseudosolanacearum]QIK24192.1 hypothetical protein G7939_12660 [Ralstonia solanacearum]ASL74285.1 hypothetical protein BC350_12170 [Ralstonia pseudosolanacearum]MCK4117674.1 hypothetical protein [Ralstonia pseudosolanacearum]QIK27772.1 hypothetical protein G7947_05160 [Ralstonia solanacearum]QIK32677.1 hypothetical protein G7969_05160 [Ralstonia solanacearum]
MIKKKNNTYMLLKENAPKLALIHYATEFSPNRLAAMFLRNLSVDDFVVEQMTDDGYWEWKLADNTTYKYFHRQVSSYLKKYANDPSFQTMVEHLESAFLTRKYFGPNYQDLAYSYFLRVQSLKDFARADFIAKNPITPEMSRKELAIRNQLLGKISVRHWIGDITNYEYFSQAPTSMRKDVQGSLQQIDRYIVNLLNDTQFDKELFKFSASQKLQARLAPKSSQAKSKPIKI